MSLLTDIARPFLEPLFKIIDKAVPNKDERNKLKQELELSILAVQEKALEAQAATIIAEASGESWLQRTWRPLFMVLLMVSLAGSALFGMYGQHELVKSAWTAIPEEMWSTLRLGLGGYIGGRSAEKIAKTVAPIFKR